MPLVKVVRLIMCLSLVMCHSQRDILREHSHIASEKSFPCKVPQPRVFYVEDLIEEKKWKDEYEAVKDDIIPFATILHRCESAGCCDKRIERCLPVKPKNVTLIFGVGHTKMDYFEVKAENHTNCSCQKIT